MQGVDARRIEGVRHHPAHRAHIDAPVGAPGPVSGDEPQPFGQAVILGGVGVHHQHLGGRAVLFNGEGQWVFDLRRDVRRTLPGIVLDAARPAGDVFVPGALRIVFFHDRAGVCRAGVLALQGHEVVFYRSGKFLHRFRHLRRGRGFFLWHGSGRDGLRRCNHCLLPHPEQRLRRRERSRQDCRQHQRCTAGEHAQRGKQRRRFQKEPNVGVLLFRQRDPAAHENSSFLVAVTRPTSLTPPANTTVPRSGGAARPG